MDEQGRNPLEFDAIVARHPEYGFVIDGDVAPLVEEPLRRLGYHRNEHNVLALRPDLDEQTARSVQVRAAQLLAVTGHAVMVLPDDKAAAAAVAVGDRATPQPEFTDEAYVAAANVYYASHGAVLPSKPTFCPECGEDMPAESDVNAEHVYADNGVLLVGCEGYHVQNPNTFGITAPHWQDWRTDI